MEQSNGRCFAYVELLNLNGLTIYTKGRLDIVAVLTCYRFFVDIKNDLQTEQDFYGHKHKCFGFRSVGKSKIFVLVTIEVLLVTN